eukprot:2294363-Pyramimonas_sp.AAC.1
MLDRRGVRAPPQADLIISVSPEEPVVLSLEEILCYNPALMSGVVFRTRQHPRRLAKPKHLLTTRHMSARQTEEHNDKYWASAVAEEGCRGRRRGRIIRV